MFTIDGLKWDMPCSIKRTAEITASEISGMLMNKRYFNDIIGTFMRYTIEIAVPTTMRDQYTAVYDKIIEPVDGHSFVLPYNNNTITINGRVENIADVYVRRPGGGNDWRGIQFEVIANHPSKTMGLSQVLALGMSPLPDAASPSIGDIYTWTGSQWSVQGFANADNISY